VRSETLRFYGTYDVLEAQYPGLDYSSSAHRLRLRCFQWHRRLFRVFDELRLTSGEIYHLCRWEGTKWAKDKYEKDHGMKIKDTTWDDIKPVQKRRLPVTSVPGRSYRTQSGGRVHEGVAVVANEYGYLSSQPPRNPCNEVLSSSVGMSLNQRLRAATAARLRGQDVGLDPAWDHYMKESEGRRSSSRYGSLPPSLTSSNPPVSSRSRSRWSQTIPDIFRFGSSTSRSADAQRRMVPPPALPSSRHRSSTTSNPRSSSSFSRRWR
jgi:hypothetical protein